MKTPRVVVVMFGLASCLGLPLGSIIACCPETETYTEDQLDFCTEMNCPKFVYYCGVDSVGDPVGVCVDSESEAVTECFNAGPSQAADPPTYWACPDDIADGGETGNDEVGDGDGDPWDPGSYVSYDPRSEIYEIDQAFVQSLIEGHLMQLQNDSARLVVGTGDYYHFVDVAGGDLAALLGLMSGDILQSINGYDLGGFEDQITAFTELAEETSFYVTVGRASGPVTLYYELVN